MGRWDEPEETRQGPWGGAGILEGNQKVNRSQDLTVQLGRDCPQFTDEENEAQTGPEESSWDSKPGSLADAYCLFNEITKNVLVDFSLWVKPFPR